MNLLFVSRGGLGDFILYCNAVRQYINLFPQSTINAITSPSKIDLGRILLPKVNWMSSISNSLSDTKRIDATLRFDFYGEYNCDETVFDKVVYNLDLYHEFDEARSNRPISLRNYYEKGYTYADVITRSIGIVPDNEFIEISSNNASYKIQEEGFNNYLLVCNDIDPRTGKIQTKKIPLPLWKLLLDELANCGIKIIEVGVNENQTISSTNYLDLGGKTSIVDLISIISGANSILCIEGGISHLSAVLRKKALVVSGPTPASFYVNAIHDSYTSGICIPCSWNTADWHLRCSKNIDSACMKAIDINAIVQRVNKSFNIHVN